MIVLGSRDEGTEVDMALVSRDVQNLYSAGEGSIGTNEKAFIEVLASRNWLHVQEIANQYDAAYGSLETAIINNNVDAENALCTIAQTIKRDDLALQPFNHGRLFKRRAMANLILKLAITLFVCSGWVKGQDIPTLIPPVNFDPVADAAKLNQAIAGLGTNEDKIIEVLCYRSFWQRAQITDAYYTNHGNLLLDLQDDLSGEFLSFTTMLTYNTSTFLSIEFHEAISGFGSNEPTMTEIIISRTNQELADMQLAYETYYGTPLLAAIEGEVSGSLRDLYVMIVQGSRDEGTDEVDMALVSRDVQNLYNAGEGSIGSNEKVFIEILASRSWLHIHEIANLYDATYGSLETAIIKEFNNVDAENALCTIVKYSRNKAAYFANRFFLAIDGFGRSSTDLDRLAISRCETDLGNIKIEYENIYRVPLRDAIAGDTDGSHQKGLFALLG